AAAAIQRALHAQDWPPEAPLRVRLALHTGEADLRDGDYYGSAVNRCARLRAIAHGGQALLSVATEELVRDGLPEGVTLHVPGAPRAAPRAPPAALLPPPPPGRGGRLPAAAVPGRPAAQPAPAVDQLRRARAGAGRDTSAPDQAPAGDADRTRGHGQDAAGA